MLQEGMPEADRIICPRIRCKSVDGRLILILILILTRIGCEKTMMMVAVTSGGRVMGARECEHVPLPPRPVLTPYTLLAACTLPTSTLRDLAMRSRVFGASSSATEVP